MSNKDLPNLNIVIIGHVDSGKSTTCGQLVAKFGKIDQRTLDKYEKEANEMGKGSFKFAWVMDNLKAERERGITISTSLNQLYLKSKKITIIDAPGHRDFIKNMISGTSQADVAILMISASKGEFEAGISETGQTREHVLLAQTLGIKNIVVCVNKMDTTMEDGDKEFRAERFNEIKNYMTEFLTNLNYKPAAFCIIPVSGFHGDNLFEKSERCSWYKGDTLASKMESLVIPKRPISKPLRLPLSSIYKINGVGTVATGRVETGVLRVGKPLVFAPGKVKSVECKSIEMHHTAVPEANPGDNVGFSVKLSQKELKPGMVVGYANETPPKECKSFWAKVIIIDHKGLIRIGYSPVLHIHAAHVTVRITNMKNSFDRRSGKIIEAAPQSIKKDQGAELELTPTKPLVCESFKEFPPLGRFSLRDSNKTVGVGVIKLVETVENQ